MNKPLEAIPLIYVRDREAEFSPCRPLPGSLRPMGLGRTEPAALRSVQNRLLSPRTCHSRYQALRRGMQASELPLRAPACVLSVLAVCIFLLEGFEKHLLALVLQ